MPGSALTIPTTARSLDTVIDATGKYVMPGIVNTHMHWHEERLSGAFPVVQYERNLYLAAGVTTAREVGGDFDKSKRWQAARAPRTRSWRRASASTRVGPASTRARPAGRRPNPAWIRRRPREGRRRPQDHRPMDRTSWRRPWTRRTRSALRTAVHIAVGRDHRPRLHRARRQLIEHFYGVAGRRLDGHSGLPARDELHRTRSTASAGPASSTRRLDPGEAARG